MERSYAWVNLGAPETILETFPLDLMLTSAPPVKSHQIDASWGSEHQIAW